MQCILTPEEIAAPGIEDAKVVINTLHGDVDTVSHWRTENFTADPAAPQLITALLVQGDHFTVERAQQNHAGISADATADDHVQTFAPDDLASITFQGRDFAIGSAYINPVTVNGRLEAGEAGARPLTNRPGPYRDQLNLLLNQRL